MILAFKERFKQPILDGKKAHSIREDKHDRWKEGKIIHFSTGVRTKHYNCFMLCTCKHIQEIEIGIRRIERGLYESAIKVDGRVLSEDEAVLLAKKDGFDNLFDFFDYFKKSFKGKIIHWTNFKY